MENDNEYLCLLDLLNSVLKDKQPKEPDHAIDWGALLNAAEAHSAANMACYAAERLERVPPDIMKRWREVRDKALMKDVIQRAEFEKLSAALKAHGIRFIPLKGFILKSLYPQSDMRLMSDIDLLIDAENAPAARDIMTSLGYGCEEYGRGVHDVYYKRPVMNVEIHRELFGYEGREFAAVFADPWGSASDSGGLWQMTPDYCFAYTLAHAAKHFEEGGTGIRTIMDLWLYSDSNKDSLDVNRVLSMLDATGSGDICRKMLRLSRVWFGGEAHDQGTLETQRYVFRSGTYGTYENFLNNSIERSGRGKYVLELIFPPFDRMKRHYPELKKAPVLLPFCWLCRLVTKPIVNRKQNIAKVKALKNKPKN